MARAQIGETDSLPASRTYLNANIGKDDALQTATGIAESGTNIGAIGTLPTGAIASTDTLRNGVLKLEGRTSAAGPKHGVDSLRTARELGANFNYRDAEYGVEGTTNVDGSGAAAQEYPGGEAIYTVEISYSAGAGGSAGRLKIVRATTGVRTYVRVRSETVWGPWRDAAPLGGQTYTLLISMLSDWSGPSGGFYTLSIPASVHGLGRIVVVSDVHGVITPPFSEPLDVDWTVDQTNGATGGDVMVSVTDSPDNRFLGWIILRSYQ